MINPLVVFIFISCCSAAEETHRCVIMEAFHKNNRHNLGIVPNNLDNTTVPSQHHHHTTTTNTTQPPPTLHNHHQHYTTTRVDLISWFKTTKHNPRVIKQTTKQPQHHHTGLT
jgi:hypothetical protein